MEFIINNIFDLFYFITDFLLKQTIYTLILFIIIFALAFLLRKKSPLWQFGLWTLILIRLILPADLSFPINIPDFADNFAIVNYIPSAIESILRTPIDEQIINSKSVSYDSVSAYDNNSIITGLNNIQIPDKPFSWSFLVLAIWITGCLIMILLILKKWFLYHLIIKNSSLLQEDRIDSVVKHWQDRLKIKRNVKIISSDEFLSPFTTGIFNPVIYIPARLISSSDADIIRSIIAHEMVHIKSYDSLWIKFQTIIQIIYFFNPVIWYANRQISQAREQICDSIVLAKGNISPKTYGNSILHVLKHNLFGLYLSELLPCFGSHRTIFKQRIQNIIKENTMKKNKPLFILLIICLIGLIILPLVSSCNNETKFDVPMNQDNPDNVVKDLRPLIVVNGIEIQKQKEFLHNLNNVVKDLRPLIFRQGLRPFMFRQVFVVNRSEIQKEVLDNLDNALIGLRAGLFIVNGVMEGFKLYRVDQNNFLYKYGVRSGDIIKTINEGPVNNMENIYELEEIIKKEKSITFTIERNGQLQGLDFYFTN